MMLALGRIAAAEFPLAWDVAPSPGFGLKAAVETRSGKLLCVETHRTSSSARILCFRSNNGGTSWFECGVVAADPDTRTDIGDSALVRLQGGEILCSYRHNRAHDPNRGQEYSIRVAVSRDEGATWQPHSTVAENRGGPAGLWSSFLLQRCDGTLQCYFDDEVTPWKEGFQRHQWLTMKTWDTTRNEWKDPVTVSRSHNKDYLSRDGMCSATELPDGSLVCVFEGVRVIPPHKSVVRSVTSTDGGRTWNWSTAGRKMVYAPRDHMYNAIAPWLIRLKSGALLCVFSTDEDRLVPDTPSSGRLDQDIKAVYSLDDGKSWSPMPQKIADDHPCYLAGIVEVTSGKRSGQVLLQYSGRKGPSIRWGKPK